ncbi:hypothetical protein [Nitrososphaera sp.]|uniref:hypothetical protein n=1 Tax=Nitrososphaera sp. TaxID=1971748 RepID=UPI00307D6765
MAAAAVAGDEEQRRRTANSAVEMAMWPFTAGRMALDLAMAASVAWARMAQVALKSADVALSGYIEMTEQEMRRSYSFSRGAGGRHAGKESVSVE